MLFLPFFIFLLATGAANADSDPHAPLRRLMGIERPSPSTGGARVLYDPPLNLKSPGRSSSSSPSSNPTSVKLPAPPRFQFTSSGFGSFVANVDNFKISRLPMNRPEEEVGITGNGAVGISGGDPAKTCFIVHPNRDKITDAVRRNITSKGGKYETASNPGEVFTAIKNCAARLGKAFDLVFCVHGRPGFTMMGLTGLERLNPDVLALLANVAKLGLAIGEARFISCQLGDKILESNFHIMKQVAAAWDTRVLAFDKNVGVNSRRVAVKKDETNAIVVRLNERGRAERAGTAS